MRLGAPRSCASHNAGSAADTAVGLEVLADVRLETSDAALLQRRTGAWTSRRHEHAPRRQGDEVHGTALAGLLVEVELQELPAMERCTQGVGHGGAQDGGHALVDRIESSEQVLHARAELADLDRHPHVAEESRELGSAGPVRAAAHS